MNISKEILNTIDGLAERFGIVIDWSKENVYPQVADLCERFIHYKLACQWVWFALFAIILTIGIVFNMVMAAIIKVAGEAERRIEEMYRRDGK